MLRSLDTIILNSHPTRLLASGNQSALLRGGGTRYKTDWHWHDCHMFLLPLSGAIEFKHEVRPRGTWLSEERFAFVPASHAHETEAARANNSHLAVYVSNNSLSRLTSEIGGFRKLLKEASRPSEYRITPQLRVLLRLCNTAILHDPIAMAAQNHLFSALLIASLEQMEKTSPLNDASREPHGDLLIDEICRQLQEGYNETVGLDELSDRFGISRRHMTRLFKEKTGLSIAQYRESARLSAATRLLQETSLAVSEIAWRTGYDSGPSLSRAMKKETGHTPSDYRKLAV